VSEKDKIFCAENQVTFNSCLNFINHCRWFSSSPIIFRIYRVCTPWLSANVCLVQDVESGFWGRVSCYFNEGSPGQLRGLKERATKTQNRKLNVRHSSYYRFAKTGRDAYIKGCARPQNKTNTHRRPQVIRPKHCLKKIARFD